MSFLLYNLNFFHMRETFVFPPLILDWLGPKKLPESFTGGQLSALPLCGPQIPLLAWASPLLAIVLFARGRILIAFTCHFVISKMSKKGQRFRSAGYGSALTLSICGGEGEEILLASHASYRTSSEENLGFCMARGLKISFCVQMGYDCLSALATLWGSLVFSSEK